MIRFLRSTSLRLALAYAAIFILSSLLLVGFIWWRTTSYLQQETDAVILADAQAIGDRLQDFGLPGAIETIEQRIATPSDDEYAIYLLTDPTLSRVAGNLNAWPAAVGPNPGWYDVELAHRGQLHATRFLYVRLGSGYDLLVGRDVQDRVAIQTLIVDGLAWAALAAVVLALIGGIVLRRAIMARVDAINRTAIAIVHGDLSRRVPVRGASDEFDQLAEIINGMLQQIEILVAGVRNASNVVAHDLRTPLAELRNRLEGILRARPAPAEVFREIEGAATDLDRLIGIFNALLRLAEIDSGARLTGFKAVTLDKVIVDVADLYLPLAEEKEVAIAIDAPPGFTIIGDASLLTQAIGNLVDNAVKFAPPGTAIELRLERSAPDAIAVIVADQGPGIPDAEKEHATERFFRGHASKNAEGVGLGLSTVAAVARLHGGSLSFQDGHPGLIARLELPGTDESALSAKELAEPTGR